MTGRVARSVLKLVRYLALVFVAGFVAALLISHAPGAGVDSEEMNFRRSASSIEEIRANEAGDRSALQVYASILKDAAHGSLGFSDRFQTDVARLLRERAALTVREIAAGTLIGWSLVVVFVACELWLGALSTLTRGIAIATLLVPTAALAAALGLLSQLAPIICVAVVVFGRSHPIVAEALQDALGSRAVFFARANGLSAPRRFFSTALPAVMPELIATIGLSLNVAIGAVIAAEAVCDRPGLGRLAIEASLARDPRVVVLLSMLICGVTLLANAKHTERIHAEALR